MREELEKSFFVFGRGDPSSGMCALESVDAAHERRNSADNDDAGSSGITPRTAPTFAVAARGG